MTCNWFYNYTMEIVHSLTVTPVEKLKKNVLSYGIIIISVARDHFLCWENRADKSFMQ